MPEFQIKFLKKSKIWIIFGTFKSVLSQFEKLLTMNSSIKKLLVMYLCTFEQKNQTCYESFFSSLKNFEVPHLNDVIVDFKEVLINSISISFNICFRV